MFRVFKDEYKTQNWNKHQKLHRVCERKMEHFYKKWKKNKYVCPIVYLRQYFKQSFSLELFFFLFGIAPKRNKKVQRLIFFIQFLKAFIQFLIIFYCLHELASLRFICFHELTLFGWHRTLQTEYSISISAYRRSCMNVNYCFTVCYTIFECFDE